MAIKKTAKVSHSMAKTQHNHIIFLEKCCKLFKLGGLLRIVWLHVWTQFGKKNPIIKIEDRQKSPDSNCQCGSLKQLIEKQQVTFIRTERSSPTASLQSSWQVRDTVSLYSDLQRKTTWAAVAQRRNLPCRIAGLPVLECQHQPGRVSRHRRRHYREADCVGGLKVSSKWRRSVLLRLNFWQETVKVTSLLCLGHQRLRLRIKVYTFNGDREI